MLFMALQIFNGLDANTIVLGLLFVIFFVLIQLLLSRSLKDKGTSSIIAFCISLLSVYGLSKTNFDFTGIFYNIGINDTIIYTVIPIIIIAGLIFIFWKVKLRVILVVLGLMLIVGSRFVYEKTIVMIVGIILLIWGIILMWVESRRRVRKGYYLRGTR